MLKNIIAIFTSQDKTKSGTLMSRMAQNQEIGLGSDTYSLGINQFEGNLTDIIELVREKNVPIIISTLASNIKDQIPFVSKKDNEQEDARTIYKYAQNEYQNLNFKKADSLFRLAKDLDQLRFRAPDEINGLIKNLGNKFNIPIVNADSILSHNSTNGIIGKNLMTILGNHRW
ncbi:hypothetical protein [Desulfosarcina sp.]|uniref:hypothetical protein n=1 Tax=Desulfosarcina sp. TaxID=2027861 RepID=UPI0029BD6B65|nr:hypothetical protein [Desulfosarcina sp.]MDX2452375.1 hypothetical protein [Desulfosarcina sp.]MDX2490155.1 hypothetical protein [Desulfosarcina sp.]